MRHIIVVIFFLLTGCGSLNFRTAPLTIENCHYSSMINTEFVLNPLPSNILSYPHIYIAQSR